MHSCSINGKYFDWILISRRSCFRAGVRYYVRGEIDSVSVIYYRVISLLNILFYSDTTIIFCILFFFYYYHFIAL